MATSGSTEARGQRPRAIVADRTARCCVVLIYAACAAAFVTDLYRDNTLAYGIIYTPVIATALLHKSRWGLWALTSLACGMVIVGAFFPLISPDLMDMLGNRALSIIAILATAAFVKHARDSQDRLAAETRRAEAAERVKSQVLTNLSQEIRTPLHTLLGVVTLTMASSKPEQRSALGQVRTDGRHLLATIDNLIDLTQMPEHALQQQTVDVATIARDAAESAGASARERQVTLVTSGDRETRAVGDSWAMRRILDNLLANAVRLTPPGGTVSVAVNREGSTVTASVSDTGKGMPPGLTESLQDYGSDFGQSAFSGAGGTGLALSSSLAQAMNGRLIARNLPGSGAMVILSLPAV
jgi:signal transduction histidine kinase